MHFSVCLSVKEKESMIWQVFPIFEYINSWRQILLLDWIQSVCVHHLLRTKSRHFERVNLWPSVFCNTSFFSSNSTNLQLITQTDKLIEVKWPSPNWLPSSSSSSQLVLTITPHTHTHTVGSIVSNCPVVQRCEQTGRNQSQHRVTSPINFNWKSPNLFFFSSIWSGQSVSVLGGC